MSLVMNLYYTVKTARRVNSPRKWSAAELPIAYVKSAEISGTSTSSR